jgi:hypothetical protein
MNPGTITVHTSVPAQVTSWPRERSEMLWATSARPARGAAGLAGATASGGAAGGTSSEIGRTSIIR